MFFALFSLVSCDWIEKPEITIGQSAVTTNPHTKRTFRSLTAAKPYINSILGSERASSVLNKLKFTSKISIDFNSMTGDEGNKIDRIFGRDHCVFSATKDENGAITCNFARVSASCTVNARQIIHKEKVKKKLFGLIRKHYTVLSTEWRPLTSDEVSRKLSD